MGTLSIFVDESGMFSEYSPQSPYYIVSLVFHNQAIDISGNIERLSENLSYFARPDRAIHTGPIIRGEFEYRNLTFEERTKIFNNLFYFTRRTACCYKTIVVEKKQLSSPTDIGLISVISKKLTVFLKEYMDVLLSFDKVNVYYDNGQVELTKIIVSVFSAILGDIDFRRVLPSEYRLFQVADLICTLELLSQKAGRKALSSSEIKFFSSERALRKSYLTLLKDKQFSSEAILI